MKMMIMQMVMMIRTMVIHVLKLELTKYSLTYALFYKHTDKVGLRSICLKFSQFEPEIMLKACLISKRCSSWL